MSADNPFIKKPDQVRKPYPKEHLIFLDFDGVVHPRPEEGIPTSWEMVIPLIGKKFFLVEPVRQVLRLCETLNAKVVLTTSWRNKGFHINDINTIFNDLIIGQTPEKFGRMNESGLREREINAFLDEFCDNNPYVIIDDKIHNFTDKTSNLYLTVPDTGLTEGIASEIIQSFSE